ncbi:MAG: exo-alpha-sialidase [Candidatus Hydrogenedentes bacterium]|nr:exo-alpha-sialidase [Candidatus Hydrogenedentota bacterium]
MRTQLIVFVSAAVLAPAAVPEESWRLPLSEKERALEEGIQQRHNILGLYPSMVEIPREGGPIDVSTANPFADIHHAVCWTANYLAGASYRYAVLKESGAAPDVVAAAKERADEIFEAVYRCQRVTGRRGLQARGYFLGHGETYSERTLSDKKDFWHQSEVDGQALRWVGDQSHHNYSDAIHGLGQYYDLAAEGEQKARCQEAIDALVSYWVDNDLIIENDKGRPVYILGLTDGKTLDTRIMMAIAGAKVAHHATGNEKFKAAYDRLVEQYGVRALTEFKPEKDFDDAEHVFCHLENLFRIEDDPELLAAYRVVADGLWANHVNDAQSLFTYIYYAVAPDAPGKDKALAEAFRSLQTWPTDMTIRPRMNSLDERLKPPYPVYAAAWDNEYIWKGNLLRADGWLGRTVIDVAVPAEDPMVIYAVDQSGGVYQSRDGAASFEGWVPVDGGRAGPARAIAAGSRVRCVYAACDDGFYASATGGDTWERLPVPGDGRPADILVDPANPLVLYAVTDKGVWRSRDFGDAFIGKTWDALTAELPPAANAAFTMAPGAPGRIYARLDGLLFTRRLDEDAWTSCGPLGLAEETTGYPWLVADPGNPDHALFGLWSKYGGLGTVSLLQQTMDGGRTWAPGIEDIYRAYAEGGMMALVPLLIQGSIAEPAIPPSGPGVLFMAGGRRGVLKSTDGGASWQEKRAGFEIPVAQSVMAPAHTDWVFAGTPGGLYVSKDGGESWADGHLWLQFTKNTRRELGGAAFIDAYWRGRYRGFITEAAASAPYQGD